MNTKHGEFGGFHTRNDTVGCAAVLSAILLGILSGVIIVYTEATQIAAYTVTLLA